MVKKVTEFHSKQRFLLESHLAHDDMLLHMHLELIKLHSGNRENPLYDSEYKIGS